MVGINDSRVFLIDTLENNTVDDPIDKRLHPYFTNRELKIIAGDSRLSLEQLL
jgi:hypothetical protein